MNDLENYKEILGFFLPEWILDYFDCNSVEKLDWILNIKLTEKNNLNNLIETSNLSKNQKIVSKWFKDFLVDDFPVRWRRVRLKLKRRVWQIQELDSTKLSNKEYKPVWWLIKRDIPITFPNTKLNKEFADFLKDADRARANWYC